MLKGISKLLKCAKVIDMYFLLLNVTPTASDFVVAVGLFAVMGFRGYARVRANPFLECRDNQRIRSCFLL